MLFAWSAVRRLYLRTVLVQTFTHLYLAAFCAVPTLSLTSDRRTQYARICIFLVRQRP
jgi:hypothetical protein